MIWYRRVQSVWSPFCAGVGSCGGRERLAHFKAPRGVTFVSELPKTATGKIQKFVLRKGAPNLTRQ